MFVGHYFKRNLSTIMNRKEIKKDDGFETYPLVELMQQINKLSIVVVELF